MNNKNELEDFKLSKDDFKFVDEYNDQNDLKDAYMQLDPQIWATEFLKRNKK